MNEFFTWTLLGTFAGATMATALITQFVKEAFKRIPTQLVSYIIALVLLVVATAATSGANGWQSFAILPLDAILVSLASNGGYQAVTRITKDS